MDLNDRVAALSPGEREVLPLMLQHTDTKLIARDLGISISAVDKRLSGARSKLGVTRSIDAALLFARAEGIEAGRTVQVVPSATVPAPIPGEKLVVFERRDGFWRSLLPSRERPFNALARWVRNLWIVGFMLLLAISAVLVVNVADTLSRLHRTSKQGAAATRYE